MSLAPSALSVGSIGLGFCFSKTSKVLIINKVILLGRGDVLKELVATTGKMEQKVSCYDVR